MPAKRSTTSGGSWRWCEGKCKSLRSDWSKGNDRGGYSNAQTKRGARLLGAGRSFRVL